MKAQTRVSLFAALVIGWSLVGGLSAFAQTTSFNSNVNLTATKYAYQFEGFNVLRISAPTGGFTNLFVGKNAGVTTKVQGDTFIGSFAGSNTTVDINGNGGSQNSFLGYQAGFNNTTGGQNTFVGYRAAGSAGAFGLPAGTGSSNTFVGYQAGFNITSGNANTFLGTAAGQFTTTGTRNVFIGISAGSRNSSGNGNIYVSTLGPPPPFITPESNTIRLGEDISATYIAGIYGATINSGKLVCIDSTGKLGTTCTINLAAQEDLIRSQAQRIEDLEVRLSKMEALLAK